MKKEYKNALIVLVISLLLPVVQILQLDVDCKEGYLLACYSIIYLVSFAVIFGMFMVIGLCASILHYVFTGKLP